MKLNTWAMIIVIVMTSMFALFYIDTKVTKTRDDATTELTQALTEAMYDVAIDSDWDFDNPASRESFVKSFRNRLAAGMGYGSFDDRQEAMMQKIPVVALASYSGVYFYYSDTYVDSSDGNTYITKVMSPKVPYKTVCGSYAVDMSFDGTVSVEVSGSTNVYTGRYEDVYIQLGKPAVLNFMENSTDYVNAVASCATRLIEANIENYVDTGLYGADDRSKYMISMPSGETSTLRSITGPCVVTLYQGGTLKATSGENVAVYSMVAADLQDQTTYTVLLESNGTNSYYYYHKEGCTHTGVLVYKGTMDECAAHGAYPCPDCVRK